MGPVPAPRPSVLNDDDDENDDDAMQVLHHARAHRGPSHPRRGLGTISYMCYFAEKRAREQYN